MIKLGWFSTGRGPGSRNLFKTVADRIREGSLDAEIAFVFCNWDNTEENNPRKDQREMFFDLVRSYGVPLVTASWKKFKPDLRREDEDRWRLEYGKILRKKTEPYPFDLGILAGYMLWMDDDTCREYDMLNLHPALPDGPKGTWEEVIWELIENDASEQGAMMHVCTEEWDRGAAVSYCRFPIRGKDFDRLWNDFEEKLKGRTFGQIKEDEGAEEPLFRKIREEGAKRELPLIVSTIGAFAEGKVSLRNKEPYSGNKKLDKAYDLTEEVDAALR
ncbi:MAG: phosphoribosylglycinamide formyltransferase [Candidatus Methanomethylophilaceae archaeon]|jgi:phosphoribosylglycinamide formyltransferase-1